MYFPSHIDISLAIRFVKASGMCVDAEEPLAGSPLLLLLSHKDDLPHRRAAPSAWNPDNEGTMGHNHR